VKAVVQVYFTAFDSSFFKLSPGIRERIEAKIDEVGRRLNDFAHHHLTGTNRYRLRVGDYRVIYTFDVQQGLLFLLAVGHRREIYRRS
jgi:mRNA interferase RelE/StbE